MRCTVALFFFLVDLFVLAGCQKDSNPVFQQLFFEIPLTVRPAQASMHLGDTLWLEADYSDSLLDIRSRRKFRFSPQDAKPLVFVSFFQLTGNPEPQRGFSNAFQVLNKVGRIYNLQSTAGYLEPAYQNGRYRIKIGMVAMRTGVASITINLDSGDLNPFRANDNIDFLDLGKDRNGRKITPVLGNIYYLINNGNTNFPLLQQHSKTFSTEPNAPEATVYYEQKSRFNVVIE